MLARLEAELVRLQDALTLLNGAKVELEVTAGVPGRELADLRMASVALARAIERLARQAKTLHHIAESTITIELDEHDNPVDFSLSEPIDLKTSASNALPRRWYRERCPGCGRVCIPVLLRDGMVHACLSCNRRLLAFSITDLELPLDGGALAPRPLQLSRASLDAAKERWEAQDARLSEAVDRTIAKLKERAGK